MLQVLKTHANTQTFVLLSLGCAEFELRFIICLLFHDWTVLVNVCSFQVCLCFSLLRCFKLFRPTESQTEKISGHLHSGVSFLCVASRQLNIFLLLFAEVVWRPPPQGQPGPSAGLGWWRHLGVHQAGLHPEAVPRPHHAAPAGRRHRALRQQDARSVSSTRLNPEALTGAVENSGGLICSVAPCRQVRGNLASHSSGSRRSRCRATVCGSVLGTGSSSPSLWRTVSL